MLAKSEKQYGSIERLQEESRVLNGQLNSMIRCLYDSQRDEESAG